MLIRYKLLITLSTQLWGKERKRGSTRAPAGGAALSPRPFWRCPQLVFSSRSQRRRGKKGNLGTPQTPPRDLQPLGTPLVKRVRERARQGAQLPAPPIPCH